MFKFGFDPADWRKLRAREIFTTVYTCRKFPITLLFQTMANSLRFGPVLWAEADP
jgi:hypothetical protein